jgi:prolyl-tRNA synthetase
MRISRYFLPTLREIPKEAEIASHRLMLRAGMLRQEAAGIYAWLPLGLRVLKKIEQIVREEQDRAGAQEMLMPTLQSADYWRATGRYDAYGPEMLRIRDRQDRELVYGPTNEDMLTAILQGSIKSYRDLPRTLYHIQWKFRDEIRPRFGVMRGREFLMKDAYSFDLDEAGARISYNKMFVAYLRTFARMGLRAIPMQADTGPIGGDLSHEFIILAPSGESEVFFHKSWEELRAAEDYVVDAEEPEALQAFVDSMTSDYAATEEKRDEARESQLGGDLRQSRGIEVGHIFYFADKYTKPLGFTVSGRNGEPVTPVGGSYGIGVSRLVGAIVEASHDEAGIIWPGPVAPWKVGLVTMRADDESSVVAAKSLFEQLREAGVEVLYDDRDERGGAKLASMDLIGLPWQVIVGPRGIAAGTVELKNRRTGEREEISLESALARLTA